MAIDFQQLDVLDQPRGVVKAANMHAAGCVGLADQLAIVGDEHTARIVIDNARRRHAEIFDAFVTGARWAEQRLEAKTETTEGEAK